MQIIEQITSNNFKKAKEIYNSFKAAALKDYKYSCEPVSYEQFISNIENNKLGALVLLEKSIPKGILIYSIENHKVIEVNIIHTTTTEDENNVRFLLLAELIKIFQSKNDLKIISYPLLGKQESFIRDIALLNFKMVGQSTIKFDFKSPISFRIFKKAQTPQIEDYKLLTWDNKYKEQVIELINHSFKKTKSVNFDPRFLTYEGSKNVLEMILNNQYGVFLPSQCRLLLSNEEVKGFCLTTMVEEDKINIPLIAVKKDLRNEKMGNVLLKSVISGFLKLITDKKISLKEINATTDTDNYPAIKMYRRLGFKEEYFYAHSYLNKDSVTKS